MHGDPMAIAPSLGGSTDRPLPGVVVVLMAVLIRWCLIVEGWAVIDSMTPKNRGFSPPHPASFTRKSVCA